MTEEAMKDDTGKLQWDILPWTELEQIAAVFEHGAAQYGRNNWKQGFRYGRLWNGIMRHLVAFKKGEDLDHSGHHHLAHAAAGVIMLLAHHNERLGRDDRMPGEIPNLINGDTHETISPIKPLHTLSNDDDGHIGEPC